VVATEVRNLAHRSAAAAKEIKDLIGSSVGNVQAGAALVDRAGRTMEDVVGSVRQVSDLIAEIAAASREQSTGLEQVNTAVMQMEHVVQQNASLVEEAAAGTEAMKTQAGSLLELVSRFKLGDHAHPARLAQTVEAEPRRPSAPRPRSSGRGEARGAPRFAPAFVTPLGAARVASALPGGGNWKTF